MLALLSLKQSCRKLTFNYGPFLVDGWYAQITWAQKAVLCYKHYPRPERMFTKWINSHIGVGKLSSCSITESRSNGSTVSFKKFHLISYYCPTLAVHAGYTYVCVNSASHKMLAVTPSASLLLCVYNAGHWHRVTWCRLTATESRVTSITLCALFLGLGFLSSPPAWNPYRLLDKNAWLDDSYAQSQVHQMTPPQTSKRSFYPSLNV